MWRKNFLQLRLAIGPGFTSFFLSALLLLNLVIPQKITVLPECCANKPKSCCKQERAPGMSIRAVSCCEAKILDLRLASVSQVLMSRNVPTDLSGLMDLPVSFNFSSTGSVHNRVGFDRHHSNLSRSSKNYPEPRIQI